MKMMKLHTIVAGLDLNRCPVSETHVQPVKDVVRPEGSHTLADGYLSPVLVQNLD